MATTLLCQPSSADTDQYLVITIRILAVVGFSYLLKFLYQLIRRPLFSRPSTPIKYDTDAEENIGVVRDDTAPATRLSLELDFDDYGGGDLGIRVPEPAYHPRGRL